MVHILIQGSQKADISIIEIFSNFNGTILLKKRNLETKFIYFNALLLKYLNLIMINVHKLMYVYVLLFQTIDIYFSMV